MKTTRLSQTFRKDFVTRDRLFLTRSSLETRLEFITTHLNPIHYWKKNKFKVTFLEEKMMATGFCVQHKSPSARLKGSRLAPDVHWETLKRLRRSIKNKMCVMSTKGDILTACRTTIATLHSVREIQSVLNSFAFSLTLLSPSKPRRCTLRLSFVRPVEGIFEWKTLRGRTGAARWRQWQVGYRMRWRQKTMTHQLLSFFLVTQNVWIRTATTRKSSHLVELTFP